jgi:hypothetical protein
MPNCLSSPEDLMRLLDARAALVKANNTAFLFFSRFLLCSCTAFLFSLGSCHVHAVASSTSIFSIGEIFFLSICFRQWKLLAFFILRQMLLACVINRCREMTCVINRCREMTVIYGCCHGGYFRHFKLVLNLHQGSRNRFFLERREYYLHETSMILARYHHNTSMIPPSEINVTFKYYDTTTYHDVLSWIYHNQTTMIRRKYHT